MKWHAYRAFHSKSKGWAVNCFSMSQNFVRKLIMSSVFLWAIAACSPQNSERKQVAREGADREAAVEAAKNHPANTGNPEATGQPLPPLPGVDTPVPKAEAEHEMHNEQAEQPPEHNRTKRL